MELSVTPFSIQYTRFLLFSPHLPRLLEKDTSHQNKYATQYEFGSVSLNWLRFDRQARSEGPRALLARPSFPEHLPLWLQRFERSKSTGSRASSAMSNQIRENEVTCSWKSYLTICRFNPRPYPKTMNLKIYQNHQFILFQTPTASEHKYSTPSLTILSFLLSHIFSH